MFVTLGQMLAGGATLSGTVDIDGLGDVTPDPETREIEANKLIKVDTVTVEALAARGL